MKNHDLDQLLRGVPVPGRTEEYWEQFPGQVTRRAQSVRNNSSHARPSHVAASKKWLLGLSLPAAAMLLVMLFHRNPTREIHADGQLDSLKESYRQLAEMFPQQLQAILFTGDKAELRLSETLEGQKSPPLFVRICPPAGQCVTAISFSGQKLQVSGTEFEVLENGAGEIFVVAKEGVWASGQVPASGGAWRVETGWLEQHL